jgi:benzoate-CoA ligase family protein
MEASKQPEIIQIPRIFNAARAFIDEHVHQGRGGNIALYYEDKKITYRDVQKEVNKMGNSLLDLGVEIEERVSLLLLDRPEFVYSFFGAMKIGAVPVPLNTFMTHQDYEFFLNDSRSKVLIMEEALWDKIEPIEKNLKYLKHIICLGTPQKGQISYLDLVNKARTELEGAETSKDDSCFWIYSSGSTGFPKGVVHLHHDPFIHADCFTRFVTEMKENDIGFSVAKLFFGFGLGNLFFAFKVGASQVLLPERPTAEGIFQIISKYRPTIFYCVPTMYARMLEEYLPQYDLSSLRVCVSGGEPLPPDLYHRWGKKLNCEIIDGIGTTENIHMLIANRPGKVKPGSTGFVIPGHEVKIVDDSGHEVPNGEIGELMLKSDSLTPGYWNQHEKNKQIIIGEWCKTGDKYYRDTDGYYWYSGRSDDMIKVGGIWVSPAQVEAALSEHEAVLESAVVGHPDESQMIKPKAFVVLRKGYQSSPQLAEELKLFVKNKIAPYNWPRWVEFVNDLPKTATGKIQRYKLRNKW